MKTTQKRHILWNIEFTQYNTEALHNLNETQAGALAEHFSTLSRRLAEAEFLLAAHENKWKIPVIENTYKETTI
jgi:hypothetical protein